MKKKMAPPKYNVLKVASKYTTMTAVMIFGPNANYNQLGWE
jgi:hypothetical protein